jgi:hypothetical protein
MDRNTVASFTPLHENEFQPKHRNAPLIFILGMKTIRQPSGLPGMQTQARRRSRESETNDCNAPENMLD